jgi:signal transduction histidine kinase
MFISGHDLTLLLVVLGFAFVAAVGFAIAVAGPLTWDLDRVASVADQVSEGDLTVRSDVQRGDEVGRVAGAFDAMIEALEEAAEQRDRDEESRRRFFAAVGHDLRTPLASLLAAIEALEDGVAPDPARYLHSMERDVAALSALVDDLFLLSRIDSGSISIASEPVDVTELADEAIEVLRPVAHRAGVSLRLEADHRTVVPGGTEAVSRAMRNLIENAIRHAPTGSDVVVEVRSGTGATVRVLDEGPGFDPGFVDHAFDRFTRADDARSRDTGGSGLGLAIARGFVDALGGEIWAEPGPGGTVAFHLPAG